jgi:hypothetical protein
MKFIVLIYNDPKLLAQVPQSEFNSTMKECFDHADAMQRRGKLLESQQLEPVASSKTIRTRAGRTTIVDGPFAETKEVLGGFNIVEADSMDEAIELALQFPWAASGAVEVRPIKDMNAVRRMVGAPAAP